MSGLRGTFTVMVTAFDQRGELDLRAQAEFTEWQIQQGIHGLIPLGSTGEFLSMTLTEQRQVAECVVRTAAGRVPVVVGAGAERTEDAMEKARIAEDIGAQGIMVIPPFYSTPTEAELMRHYERVAGATSLPVMVYNNPAVANVDLTPPVVARLSEIDGVDYIKESTMDVTRVRDIIDMCGDRMAVFGGIMGYESFASGAVGWVAVGSNLVPADSARVFTMTVDEKDHDGAREIYARMLPVIRLVGGHRYVSATKAALSLMGLPMGPPRAPRLPLPEAEWNMVRAALADAGVRQARAA